MTCSPPATTGSWSPDVAGWPISTPRSGAERSGGAEVEAPVHRPWRTRTRRRSWTLYEEVFDHQSFTGRSGTFYKYEGLGCIYWHMVSKLASWPWTRP